MIRLVCILTMTLAGFSAQQPPPLPEVSLPPVPLGAGPFLFTTAERQQRIRVVVVTKGLSHPWSLAFLPDGNMLVSERPGRLRIIRQGVLDATPVSGLPKIHAVGLLGLLDVVLHPKFADNHLVYFTYTKPSESGQGSKVLHATALARGRLEGTALVDVRDLLVTDFSRGGVSRLTFGPDGMLYMSLSAAASADAPQDPNNLRGKILRLRDDGSAALDNPFAGRAGYKPEIYSLGHRSTEGLAFHPVTGVLWNTEQGPNGGDEVNIIQPGRNYGWPLVSYGRTYEGPWVSQIPWKEGTELPVIYWMPSIATSGLAFYTGGRFPFWKGNVFVGGMRTGEIPGTGHLERIVFNDRQEELRRESLLNDLHQRIRDVRQGPDGLLYVLTDEDDGALLRIEPM